MNQTENYRRAYETLQNRIRYIDIIKLIANAKNVEDIKNYSDKTGVSYVEALEKWVSGVHKMCNEEIKKL